MAQSDLTAVATELFSSRVAQTLFRSDVCHRCVLRFSGVRDVGVYMLADDVLRRAATAASQSGGTPAAASAGRGEQICPLCLGMLQQTLSPTSLEQVAADVCKVPSTPPPPPPPPLLALPPRPPRRHLSAGGLRHAQLRALCQRAARAARAPARRLAAPTPAAAAAAAAAAALAAGRERDQAAVQRCVAVVVA